MSENFEFSDTDDSTPESETWDERFSKLISASLDMLTEHTSEIPYL